MFCMGDKTWRVGMLAFLCTMTFVSADAASLGYDDLSLKVDGKRTFLISGEFHYFRVPKEEWRRRLRLLKDVGGTCVATYIPWCIHEPEEGKILFGDRPERDLDAFLRLVKEEGMMAIVRPGPYQYSELLYAGLPRWLVEGHPEIAFKKKDGRQGRMSEQFLKFIAIHDQNLRKKEMADRGSLLLDRLRRKASAHRSARWTRQEDRLSGRQIHHGAPLSRRREGSPWAKPPEETPVRWRKRNRDERP